MNPTPKQPEPTYPGRSPHYDELNDILDQCVAASKVPYAGDFREVARTRLEYIIAEAVRLGKIEELESLKQYNGAYIGMDGKRVNQMLHRQVIEERIKALKKEKS